MWADTTADGVLGTGEPSAAITAGQFAFAARTTPTGLGVLYVNTADEAIKTVSWVARAGSRGGFGRAMRCTAQCCLPVQTFLLAPATCSPRHPVPPLQVASGSTACHDATSLLAVHFPFAAPHPASCSAKFVISPLTTLLTHAQAYSSGVAAATLLDAVGLPTTFELLTTDSLAVRRDAWVVQACTAMQREGQAAVQESTAA